MKKATISLLAVMTVLTMWGNYPWLTRVYEYRPAPGQFINTMPLCRIGEPMDSVLARCRAALTSVRIDTSTAIIDGEVYTRIDTTWAGMISLGGYGGYIVVGFDHPVVNMHGYDFEIYGNAFIGDEDPTGTGGSCEPGIVMVGVDCDGDGVPSDGDKWYELAGSEYDNPKTQHDYTITYYRPDEGKERTPSHVDSDLNDTTYIRWTSNDVNPDSTSGYMSRNVYHNQPYWPLWQQDQDVLAFSGSKLRCNAINIGTQSRPYYVQYFFGWGYVDNLPNYQKLAPEALHNPGFKIDWAVDEQGRHVNLTHIDFIKVYNAMNQYCGRLGETSTEVTGGIDFHPDAVLPAVLAGDVNGDGEVNVSDINVVVDYILSGTMSTAADVDGDGEVTVGDVNKLIDLILQ